MARTIRDSNLETRTARSRLKPRGKPYYRTMEHGLHLGYRKPLSGAGKWVLRHYNGGEVYTVETIAPADDYSDADGVAILDYRQAQSVARERMVERAHAAIGGEAPARITVADAVVSYVVVRDGRASKRKGRRVRSDAGQRLRRYVLGQPARGAQPERPPTPLAKVVFRRLNESHLREWRDELPDTLTAATRQRLFNDLRAALNAAYAKHRGQLPRSLQDTVKFGLKSEADDEGDADVADSQVLADTQITSLLRAAREVDSEEGWDGDLYRLVIAMAATGARFSQVARLRVRDCQTADSRLMMPDSRKGGRKKKIGSKPIPVASDVIAALRPAVFRRAKDQWLLERWRYHQVKGGDWERSERGPWSTSELNRPWQAIRERAGLPDATPYCLRHSSIVRGIRSNLSPRLVAAAHDTSVVIIERHYSRFIVSDLEKLMAGAVVPLLPEDEGGRVVQMRARAR